MANSILPTARPSEPKLTAECFEQHDGQPPIMDLLTGLHGVCASL